MTDTPLRERPWYKEMLDHVQITGTDDEDNEDAN